MNLLRPLRPVGVVERTRKDLAREMIAELRGIDARLNARASRLTELLGAAGSTLTRVDGVGPVLAARLVGQTGSPARSPSGSQYASYIGTAPIEVASAEHARHRLSCSGDRQLNVALHLVAVTEVRVPRCAGHAYVQRKLAEGKSRNEALRCLKRRLTSHLWQIMVAGERRRTDPHRAKPAAA